MGTLRLLFCAVVISALWGQTTNIPSLEWQERWDSYLDRTYSWKNVGPVALESAIENSFQLSKCRRAPYCFPHHVGGSLIGRTTRTTVELGAGAALKEDIRRRPSELSGFRERVMFALTHAVLARGPNGEWRPAYSRYAGTLAAVTVSSAWQGRPMTTGHLTASFGWSASNYFQDALFTEFEPDMRRMALRTWQNVRGSRNNVLQSRRLLSTADRPRP